MAFLVSLHHRLWLQWLSGWGEWGFLLQLVAMADPSKVTNFVAVVACLFEGWTLCSTTLVSLQSTAWAGLGAHLASMW